MAYARKFVEPRISEEAATQLEEEYVKMRAQGAKAVASNVITATPRQLESMIRLAEALAKMRLDAEVKVEDVKEAVAHIAAHSTGHSEAIVTRSPEAERYFTANVDSAAVYVNASTRFTDGGEFGLGCEMGISTQKLHARGPMGLQELTTYKYIIHGNGHIR